MITERDNMEKPGVVWAYSIMCAIGILWSLFSTLQIVLSAHGIFAFFNFLIAALSFIILIPQTIFVVKFFQLKKGCLTWMYISFGLGFVVSLLSASYVYACALVVLGWVIWVYVVHKKIDGKIVFN
jgi:hypothetical protein